MGFMGINPTKRERTRVKGKSGREGRKKFKFYIKK